MLNYIRQQIASLATGIAIKDIPAVSNRVRNATGASSIVFHWDGSVSGVAAGKRKTLAMAVDFA